MASPTSRTLKHYRDLGYAIDIAERWLPGVGIRKDLFGFIDMVALHPMRGVVGVQSTGTAFSAHRKKILEERREECRLWLEAGGKVDLIGWRKLKVKRGSKATRYVPRVEEITLETLEEDAK